MFRDVYLLDNGPISVWIRTVSEWRLIFDIYTQHQTRVLSCCSGGEDDSVLVVGGDIQSE